ncbi:hypothetical protein ALI22I_01045 [Saccharothrix sp. ALI-22-I]|nr:hypothetical protein ALI22I_01045 [Saccharothrix sp. ALI-22-I]
MVLVTSGVSVMVAPPAFPSTAFPSERYAFKNVKIGGAGFVSGIVFSRAQKDLACARADVGGVYQWNGAASMWAPLLDWVGWDNWGDRHQWGAPARRSPVTRRSAAACA